MVETCDCGLEDHLGYADTFDVEMNLVRFLLAFGVVRVGAVEEGVEYGFCPVCLCFASRFFGEVWVMLKKLGFNLLEVLGEVFFLLIIGSMWVLTSRRKADY